MNENNLIITIFINKYLKYKTKYIVLKNLSDINDPWKDKYLKYKTKYFLLKDDTIKTNTYINDLDHWYDKYINYKYKLL